MEQRDVIVVGGGLSGLSFAWHAARGGKTALVLEAAPKLGGCLDSRRQPQGYWYELGAHTCYNSYGALLEILEQAGKLGDVLPRGEARKRFALLREGGIATMGPLSVFLQFNLWELLRSAPRAFGAKKEGATTYAYYSRVVGKRNYSRVLGPFLSAVPSQNVDAFPVSGAGSLFKKRSRRADVVKSFTLRGGLGAAIDAMAAQPGVETLTDALVREVRKQGAAYQVRLQDGRSFEAPVVCLAVPPSMAAAMLRTDFPEIAGELARIHMVALETVGVVVRREKVKLPEMAFLVPVDDIFWSTVTRDTVPDATFRAFAFHFRTGHTDSEKLEKISSILGLGAADFEDQGRRMTVLPSPTIGHDRTVAELDRLLSGSRLALTGNYFAGLAIEDCVLRSKAEWGRVAASGS
jgi:UDP-galactopyranose mutase